MFVYVGGIPGTGKTTVIKKTVELAKRCNLSLQEINEKKLLCQITGIGSSKEYTHLSQEIRAEARRQMVAQLYELDKNDLATIRIRDDHFTAPREDGSYWIRPLEPDDKIHMLGFVVIVSTPEEILRIRLSRNLIYREPDFLDINAIAQHQDKEIQVACLQANQLQIPIKIIYNQPGEIDLASELLIVFARELIKRS